MIKQNARKQASLLIAADLFATFLALAAAWFLRFQFQIVPVTKGVPESSAYWRLLPMLAILWPVVYSFHGLYRPRRGRSRSEEAFVVFSATALADVLLAGIATFYRGFSYSRLVLVIFFLCDVPFVVAARLIVRARSRNRTGATGSASNARHRGGADGSAVPSSIGSSIIPKRACARSRCWTTTRRCSAAPTREFRSPGPTADSASWISGEPGGHGVPRAAARGAPQDARSVREAVEPAAKFASSPICSSTSRSAPASRTGTGFPSST